jgi:hypothetical protein
VLDERVGVVGDAFEQLLVAVALLLFVGLQ